MSYVAFDAAGGLHELCYNARSECLPNIYADLKSEMPRTVAIYNGDKNAIEESLVSVEEIDGVSGRRGEGGARGKVTASSMTTSEESENRLAMAVEFDHMYIGCSDSKASVGKDLEVQHLKDLLLLHLDLIQQQAEQLVAKDKQIKILRDENENVSQNINKVYLHYA